MVNTVSMQEAGVQVQERRERSVGKGRTTFNSIDAA
jgi:hypothetical protein